LKGHSAAIESFRRARLGQSILVVIGNTIGDHGCLRSCRRRSLRARWLSLGRKRVMLLDLPRSEVVAAMHAADLFIFPSLIECSPIVLFEAMASRTPFISSPCGNAPEIIEWGAGGRLIEGCSERSDGLLEIDCGALSRCIEDLWSDPVTRK